MSQVPLLFSQRAANKFTRLSRAKTLWQKLSAAAAFRPSDFNPRIGLKLGLTDPISGLNMGETAEVLAREFAISRELQDAFALESHRRACAARDRIQEEICPVYLPDGRVVQHDNGPREDQSLGQLAKLRPVFDRRAGTVTAGNSSQITDGAVALLVMTEQRAQELGRRPLGALSGYAYAGCDPARMGLGPIFAVARAEARLGLTLDHADLVEINEAFAVQVLAVLRGLRSEQFAHKELHRGCHVGKLTKDRLNVNGGAIALGHPVGATGARLVLTSLRELERRQAKRALVTLCVGGGQGAALWLERL
jgi:acetyl-CoA C-acetyltransferase/acetyl-CoA acyltransferase